MKNSNLSLPSLKATNSRIYEVTPTCQVPFKSFVWINQIEYKYHCLVSISDEVTKEWRDVVLCDGHVAFLLWIEPILWTATSALVLGLQLLTAPLYCTVSLLLCRQFFFLYQSVSSPKLEVILHIWVISNLRLVDACPLCEVRFLEGSVPCPLQHLSVTTEEASEWSKRRRKEGKRKWLQL